MNDHLATYLNDHLAGAAAGLEMIGHLIDHTKSDETRARLIAVRDGIMEEHRTLRSLMQDLAVGESSTRRLAGWLSEKMTEIKLAVDDQGDGEFHEFEALELLSLGIAGKSCLWTALTAVAEDSPAIRKIDPSVLAQRSDEQRAVVQQLRVEAAVRAFGNSGRAA
jgi:hypothetical protein